MSLFWGIYASIFFTYIHMHIFYEQNVRFYCDAYFLTVRAVWELSKISLSFGLIVNPTLFFFFGNLHKTAWVLSPEREEPLCGVTSRRVLWALVEIKSTCCSPASRSSVFIALHLVVCGWVTPWSFVGFFFFKKKCISASCGDQIYTTKQPVNRD